MITKERVRTLLDYDEITGVFKHKTTTTHKKIGDVAGFLHKGKGYRHICVDGTEYKEHRLIFMYMEGYFPKEVDHKNRIKTDNRWSNLRAATRSINCTNQGLRHDNTTGVRGLSFNDATKYKKWTVRMQRNKQKIHKSFASKEEAITYIETL